MKGDIIYSVRRDKGRLTDFLARLVKTPSQNGIDDERAVADIISYELEEIGIAVREVGSYERPSLTASIGKGGKSIILDAHTDTVTAGDESMWSHDPFSAIVEDGRMYGRGAADSKAGIAQIVYASKALLEHESDLYGRVILAFDSDEESGNFGGMMNLLDDGLRGDFAIIGYPGNEELTIGARGLLRLRLTAYGDAAHTGSRVFRGRNAVYDMCCAVNLLKDVKLEHSEDQYFYFGPRLTVTMVSGGIASNLVPDRCEAEIDIRTVPGMDKDSIIGAVRSETERLPGARFSLQEIVYHPAYRIDENHGMVKILSDARNGAFGKPPRIECAGPTNAGNLLHQYGIPAVCRFGAKSGRSHSYDEWVSISSVVDMAGVYGRSVLEFLSQDSP